MKSKKQKVTPLIANQESQTASSRIEAIVKLYREAGIDCQDMTEENLGKTSVSFTNSPGIASQDPSSESQDKAETALRYLNIRKGR